MVQGNSVIPASPPLREPRMRAPIFTIFITAAILAGSNLLSGPASAQNPSAQPAVQDASVKPIGKVISATGTSSIEHVNAVVVQATLGNRAGGVKVGDLVYRGDIVQTGADGHLGITFSDGTAFNLSPNARMALPEFQYSTFVDLSIFDKRSLTAVVGQDNTVVFALNRTMLLGDVG